MQRFRFKINDSHKAYCFVFAIVGLIFVALLLRAIFLFTGYPELTHDPASYFNNAESLANAGVLDESGWWGRDYVARFPYIYNYMWLLSIFMRVFGSGIGAVLILNTLFTAIGAVLLYFLFTKALGSRRVGLLAAALWFANPIEIAFGALPLPLVAVNTCLIAALFVAYWLLKSWGQKRFWLYALLLGATLGIANIFRPIMTVLLIALAIVLACLLIRRFSWQRLLGCLGALAVIFTVVTSMQQIALGPPEKATGYSQLEYGTGWSLLLGSNKESGGTWNSADDQLQSQIMDEVGHDLRAHDKRLRDLAIERYKDFAPLDFVTHWWNKARVLLVDGPRDSIEFELRNFPASLKRFYSVLFMIYYPIFLVALLGFGIDRFIRARTLPPFVLLVILTGLGILASHILLTEAMARYATPLIPLMFIAGMWGLFFRVKAKTEPKTVPKPKK